MKKGIHLDRDTWIVPGQILTGKPPPGSGKQLGYLPPATCHLLPPTCYLPHTTCHLIPDTVIPPTCYLLPDHACRAPSPTLSSLPYQASQNSVGHGAGGWLGGRPQGALGWVAGWLATVQVGGWVVGHRGHSGGWAHGWVGMGTI